MCEGMCAQWWMHMNNIASSSCMYVDGERGIGWYWRLYHGKCTRIWIARWSVLIPIGIMDK